LEVQQIFDGEKGPSPLLLDSEERSKEKEKKKKRKEKEKEKKRKEKEKKRDEEGTYVRASSSLMEFLILSKIDVFHESNLEIESKSTTAFVNASTS